jgi:hypothetical protein
VKRFISLIIALVFLLFFSACGAREESSVSYKIANVEISNGSGERAKGSRLVISVYVYKPFAKILRGSFKSSNGKTYRDVDGGFLVPRDFSTAPPVAKFTFLVPREDDAYGYLVIDDGKEETDLLVD